MYGKFGGWWAGLVKHLPSVWNVAGRPDCADPGAECGGGSSVLISSYPHRDGGCLDPAPGAAVQSVKREAAKNVVKYQDGDPSQGAAPHLSLHTIH